MEKTKVTGKEFKSLLKELNIADVKEDGYGYILLIIASDLMSDALMFKGMGHNTLYRTYTHKVDMIQDLLKTHGYFNEERINKSETRN